MKTAQNVAGFLGIVLGVVPLLQYLVTGRIGLWTFLVGDAPELPWAYPAVLLAVAAVVVVAADRRGRAG
ncbi:hypothetical protein [Pseudonocardia sp. HH130629-09]|uniref:hypothetical protein n=1 Tax=Pseudonocardia sp. HH130629-09 TaxID=1641402 RepID=UPI0006CB7AC9|nr:hypothetical protein [Pseudonocardia sp. HH130629-09]ALE85275.1 hypothetical protein XF36_20730 [Pseudonocardia sp. HH130629-09]